MDAGSIPIFCITLARRVDRWKRFQDQPGFSQISHTKRFLGVDGKTIDIRNDPRIALSTKRNILAKTRRSHEDLDSIGGVGCALSHIAVWQWLAGNHDSDVAIVFEDDAVIPPGLMENLKKLFQSSPTVAATHSWDILLLGGNWASTAPIQGEPNLVDVKGFFGLYGYIISKSGAKKLLEHVYPIHCHIDLWITLFQGIHGLRILGTRGLPRVRHTDLKTDIQTSNSCKLCDIPSDFNDDIVLVSKHDLLIARGAEIVCFVGACYLAVQAILRIV